MKAAQAAAAGARCSIVVCCPKRRPRPATLSSDDAPAAGASSSAAIVPALCVLGSSLRVLSPVFCSAYILPHQRTPTAAQQWPSDFLNFVGAVCSDGTDLGGLADGGGRESWGAWSDASGAFIMYSTPCGGDGTASSQASACTCSRRMPPRPR